MIDPDMTNILKGFDKVEKPQPTQKNQTLTEIKPNCNPLPSDNDSMKQILESFCTVKSQNTNLKEGLDSQQRSVNQMPGSHVMGKNGQKHPASNFLVGDKQDEVNNEITPDEVIAAWKRVFPNSAAFAGKSFDGGMSFRFHLVKDRSEVSSGIMDNDPLNYHAFLNTDGSWEETRSYMHIAPPEGSHMAFGSVKLRKKNAKKITIKMLEKRFAQVHQFVSKYADKMHMINFDIDEKLGTKSNVGEDSINQRQSFADIFKSMDEATDETSLEQELHTKLQDLKKEKLNKGDNGKYDLVENPKTGLSKYPEFEPLVQEIVDMVIVRINTDAQQIKSKMPYKEQFTLEELIKKLQELV